MGSRSNCDHVRLPPDTACIDDSLVTTIALPVGLALITATLGLSLVPDDFRRVFRVPRGVAIGMVNLAVISPFLAFAASRVFALSAVLASGLVLLGASISTELAVPAAVYASFMFVSAGCFAWLMSRRNSAAGGAT